MNSLKKKSKNYKYKIKHHNKQKGGILEKSLDPNYPEFEKKIDDSFCMICHNDITNQNSPLIQSCKRHVIHLTCQFKICPYIDKATLKYRYASSTRYNSCPSCRTKDEEYYAFSAHTVKQGNTYYLKNTGQYMKEETSNYNGEENTTIYITKLEHPKNEVIFMTEEICDNIIKEFDNIITQLRQYIDPIPNDDTITEETSNIDLNRIISMITNISTMHTTSKLNLSVNSLTITKPRLDSLFNFCFENSDSHMCEINPLPLISSPPPAPPHEFIGPRTVISRRT